ncbi:2-dehydropantoate 2-reductase [Streptomyces violaceusniger]|uniref:2-dehydropantoate 2-reductase n=1 Tax=Streptomyces violaceusniger TaxID=68280 RepID=UPI003443D6C7
MPPPLQASAEESTRLRIAVMGAGSIGCHLGGLLAATCEVTLIGRPHALDTFSKEGFELTRPGHQSVHIGTEVRLATSAKAAAGADYVLVTVKSRDTRRAALELASWLTPGATVVSLQNGLRNPATLREVLPDHPVLAGMVPYNVVRTSPRSFHQGTGGALMIEEAPLAEPLADALHQAGVPARLRPDMPQVQQAKLLMNLNNAINALSGLPLKEQLTQRGYRTCLALCQREALRAFRAEGLRPAKLGPLPPTLTPHLLRMPDWLFRRIAAPMLAIDDQARSSTWEDLQRGRPTEVDDLQGEIVELARQHGLNAPANTALLKLVHLAERIPAAELPALSGPQLLAKCVQRGRIRRRPGRAGTSR